MHPAVEVLPEEMERSMRKIAGKIVEKARRRPGQRSAVGNIFWEPTAFVGSQ
jgi:hypothetical protein